MLDLATLGTSLSDEGVEMIVIHPKTGEETTMKLKLAGVDSDRNRAVVKAIAEKYAPKFERDPKYRISLEDQDRDHAELLAALTLGWSGFTEHGAHKEFSREHAFKLYVDPHYRWLRNQVDAFIANRRNFIPA